MMTVKTEVNENSELVFKTNIVALMESLSEEEASQVVSAITWEPIFKEAIKRLTGDSAWWSSQDNDKRLEFLSNVENSLMNSYDWAILGDLKRAASAIDYHNKLYWKMYHDKTHANFFKTWLNANGFDSSYHGYDGVQEFKEYCESQFKKMKLTKAEGR